MGDLNAVLEVTSTRCDAAVTSALVRAAAAVFVGAPATISVLSAGTDTTSDNIDSDAVPGNSGTDSQFRLDDGDWRWDGCR